MVGSARGDPFRVHESNPLGVFCYAQLEIPAP